MISRFLHRVKVKWSHLISPPVQRDWTGIGRVGTTNESNRDQWVIRQLQQLSPGLVLLDAGAGEQPYKKYCSHLQYVSQDFAQYDPQNVKEGLQMKDWDYGKLDIVSDVTAIPKADESFDVVLCTEVIEHIVNPIEAIKEFSRLLKPGGQLLLTAPFCSMTHFAPYHFYSGYNRFFYEKVLPQNGFDMVEMEENGNYFEYLAQELKRLESIGIQYSKMSQPQDVKQALNLVLDYTQQCAAKDQGSKELLFFGIHVKAVKRKGQDV